MAVVTVAGDEEESVVKIEEGSARKRTREGRRALAVWLAIMGSDRHKGMATTTYYALDLTSSISTNGLQPGVRGRQCPAWPAQARSDLLSACTDAVCPNGRANDCGERGDARYDYGTTWLGLATISVK